LAINSSKWAKPCTQGRTSRSTRVLLRRDTLGEVDLPAQLAVFVALLDDRLQQVVHQQRQVLQQLPGVKVLFHGH
jgi:hypothetical protein